MLARFIFLLSFFSSWTVVTASELVLRGVYQGKDLYVQNPYSREAKEFCTKSVEVNDKVILTDPRTSAFKISLSHLKIRDIVVIRIQYREGCEPGIINPEVIQPLEGFEFLTAQASRQSVSWLTKGELPGGKFFIEREEGDNMWKLVKTSEAKGLTQTSSYEIPVQHDGGLNTYRVKYQADDDVESYSITFSYDFKEAPITFYPEVATTKLYLSQEAPYEVVDARGRKYRRGEGRIVDIQTLAPGEYFLIIKERSMPFTKKD